MKTLTLTRPHVKNYHENAFVIYIDGKLVARLQDDESKKIHIKEGTVEIQAKFLKWFGSAKRQVILKDNTTVEINLVSSFLNQLLIFLGPVIVALSTLVYKQHFLAFFLPVLLGTGIFIYAIFFRRNTWLSLTIK